MRELDLAAALPAPFVGAVERGAAEPQIKVQALVPQPAGVGDLGGGAPEEYGAEAGHSADMAQRFEDQSDCLATAGSAAIDANVRASLQKRGLRSGLCRDNRLSGQLHWSSSCIGSAAG